MLDQKYINTCRLFSHKLQLLDDRKISTNVDDYTMMISVMQGIYRHIDTIEDKTNLLKYHLFMTKFLSKFPEVARKEVVKRVNMIQEPKDMDKLLLDFDKFKWLLSVNSDPTPKKTNDQQPRQDKKRAHAVNSDRKKCAVKNCSESQGLWKCDLFKQMSTAVVRSNICSRCLNSRHTLSSCTKDWNCRTDDCGSAHHALLHYSLKSVHAHKGLLKRLESRSVVKAFDAEIQDGVSRGVWRPASEEDLNYTGPINYIMLTEAYMSVKGATTPVHVCLDASR